MEYIYRNETVQLTQGQLTNFMMQLVPHMEADEDEVLKTVIVDAALEADFFQVAGKQDAPLFVFPELGGLPVAEVDRRMQTLVDEITETINEATKATAVKAWKQMDDAREPKEFVIGKREPGDGSK